ncbi:MAG: XrtA system polysaccharide chain length determinant [Dongiaceae bacterium]
MGDLKQQALYYGWVVWRRRWLVLAVAWPICVAGWIAIGLMPSKYVASARIYVDTETLLAPLLKGIAVDVDMNQQIEVMQRTLLSRPNLEKVVRMTDLDLAVHTAADRDRLLTALAASTAIRAQGVHNLFTVEYTNADPVRARAVVQSLLTIFVESNLGNSRRDMEQARRFLDDQIRSYEEQLARADQRLADFKRSHSELNEGAGVAVRLEAARQRLLQLRSELEDAGTRRLALRAELARVPEFLEVEGAPQVVIDGTRRGPTDLESRILQLQKTLDDLQLRYTDQHPDVIATRRMLAALLAEEAKAGAPGAADGDRPGSGLRGGIKQKLANGVHEQIQLKLIEIESDIQTLQRRVAEQQGAVDRLVALSATAPEVEAQLASLNRDYAVIKRSYEEMLSRRESAKLSQNLDSTSEKVEFRIVDPPEIPARPSGPPRAMLLTGVLVAAIGAGLALALLLAKLDESFATLRALRDAVAVPVLGSVSAVLSPAERRRATIATAGFLAGLGCLLLAYGAVLAAFLHGGPVPHLLDALIGPVRNLV